MGKKGKDEELEKLVISSILERDIDSVDILVKLLNENSNFSREDILETIISLEKKKKISLSYERATEKPRFSDYLFSEDSYWYWGALMTSIVTLLVVHFISEENYPFVYVRYLFGFIFVIFVPGYSFIRLTYLNYNISYLVQIIYSVCLSILIVFLIGFTLNFTDYGLELRIITYVIFSLSLLFYTMALIRSYVRPHV